MFAYCLNNPVNGADPSGFARNATDDNNHNGIPDYLDEQWIELTNRYRAILSDVECRDVTDDVNAALDLATKEGRERALSVCSLEDWTAKSLVFYHLVNHNAPWDIKCKSSWEETIGTTYPGSDQTVVIYEGHYYTPEILGNYTFGALGRAYGFGLSSLFIGSEYAAGFPKRGTFEFSNEMADWLFIANGYYSGH